MKCQWCDEECDGTLIAYVDGKKYNVCSTCLNHLGNEEYDDLIRRIHG